MAGFVRKTIALVAHDNRKKDLVEWVEFNSDILIKHKIICTGTTGKLVRKVLENKYGKGEVDIHILKSGPLGGDQQLGAMIAEGKVDILIFLWDPMEPMPHDVDVKALLRIATLYNIPVACNRSTADFIISSPLFNSSYKPVLKDYSGYLSRTIEL
ncbi:MAG: methylglyoxal synthase [Candidatus Neomarinimicrobiota bacterium]|nr:MAG: methylglyoxal synthase [Candidatus Neomarinimicrobiota bacterium]